MKLSVNRRQVFCLIIDAFLLLMAALFANIYLVLLCFGLSSVSFGFCFVFTTKPPMLPPEETTDSTAEPEKQEPKETPFNKEQYWETQRELAQQSEPKQTANFEKFFTPILDATLRNGEYTAITTIEMPPTETEYRGKKLIIGLKAQCKTNNDNSTQTKPEEKKPTPKPQPTEIETTEE